MTKAASNRQICFIKEVLLLCEHGHFYKKKCVFYHPPILLGTFPRWMRGFDPSTARITWVKKIWQFLVSSYKGVKLFSKIRIPLLRTLYPPLLFHTSIHAILVNLISLRRVTMCFLFNIEQIISKLNLFTFT